jgi:transmembrane sensor
MKKKFQKLSIKELTGNINKADKQALENWLAESNENKKEFELIKTVWEKSTNYKIPGIPNVEDEWNALYERMNDDRIRSGARGSFFDEIFPHVKSLFTQIWKPSFSTALAIILLCAGIFIWNNERSSAKLITVGTSNKETKEILLSDGSLVKLNNGSSIKYLEKFDSKIREVELTGEAFFSVTKNSTPFVVVTDNAKISVLGTKFDVCARGEKTQVVVKEGKVSLAQKENDTGVYLTKDQSSFVTKNSNPDLPKEIDADYMLGWLNGKLVFDQTPLNEIVNELERCYDVTISVEGNGIAANTLTGSFKNRDVDSVLTMICLTMNLDFEKQGNVFLIKHKK